jgi:hypothetical protein
VLVQVDAEEIQILLKVVHLLLVLLHLFTLLLVEEVVLVDAFMEPIYVQPMEVLAVVMEVQTIMVQEVLEDH